MTQLVVATGNKGKVREFKRIFSSYNIDIKTPMDMGFNMDVEETGLTFAENAYIKAKYVSDRTGLMAVADDSGLCVEALPDVLGVYTARFCGKDAPYDVKMGKLIELMKDIPEEKRTAWFESSICLVSPDKKEPLCCSGRCYGKIGYQPKGNNGFGYDPIFMVGEKSFAQLSGEEKDAISHRGKALKAFVEKLGEYLG